MDWPQKEKIDGLESRLGNQVNPVSTEAGTDKDANKVTTSTSNEKPSDLRTYVAKLESERSKLISEVDSMSGEIERLYDENVALLGGLSETTNICHNYEAQLSEVLTLNESLRKEIASPSEGSATESVVLDLKSQLAELSAKHLNSTSALGELSKSYNPLLESIESQLLSLKSEFDSI